MTRRPPLSLGLVGYGRWGRNILRDLQALGHTVAVLDVDPGRQAEASRNGAVAAVALASQLPEIQGLIVATPAITHASVVRMFLPRGVPILVEKPLTTDVASAREIAAAAGERVFVGHIWRYHPGIEALAGIAVSGELGPVHGVRTTRTNWTSPRQDVDTSWNLVPHDLAIAHFLLGALPPPRFALPEMLQGRCVGLIGVLGIAPWAVFEVSNRHREKRREVRLHCRDGVAVLSDPDCGRIEISRATDGDEPALETRTYSAESALQRELGLFCAHCAGGPPLPTTAAEGLRVVETIVELRRLAGLVTAERMKPTLAATVVVPTSIDRGPLLAYSVGSILRQTLGDLEVFIIGDGAHDVTRDAARDLERSDKRVRFFDHRKGQRRGETYRHDALQEARGRIVCYLCDRDLYLRDHVEEMTRLLEQADFAHTFLFGVAEDGLVFEAGFDLSAPAGRRAAIATKHGVALSFFGHTLKAYRRLPQGWTTTPDGHFTDLYFSSRFLATPGMRLASGWNPTVLGFRRGSHPGWSTQRRQPELARWSQRLQGPGEPAILREEIRVLICRHQQESARLLERFFLIGGRPISLRSPAILFGKLLGTLIIFMARRPGHPLFDPMRRRWRRWRYGSEAPSAPNQ